MVPLTRQRHIREACPCDRAANCPEPEMLDLLMLVLGTASFALLSRYLTACEQA